MNNDLISRSALLEEFEWLKKNTGAYNHPAIDDHIQRIKNAPAVDAEPVVRCKDCRKGKYIDSRTILCASQKLCPTRVEPDFFCADGERKMDAEVEG